jgi:hypothetical protein
MVNRAGGVKVRQADRAVEIETPFPGQSVESQQRGIEAFESDGVPIEPVFFFTRGYKDKDTSPFHQRPYPAPTARVAGELFNSPDAKTNPGLGIDKLSFYDPRSFGGRIHHANHHVWDCDIRYLK